MLCRDEQHHRSTRTPDSRSSGALSCVLPSICSQTSSMMASTHVYRAMERAPLTVIPYKPKPRKPSNHNIRNNYPKPSARQPSRLNISQTVDSGESAETPLFDYSGLEKKVGDCVAAARDAVSSGDNAESARGMCADPLFLNDHLSLTMSSRLDKTRKRASGEI